MCVSVCMSGCVRACVRACVHACVRVCVCVLLKHMCVFTCVFLWTLQNGSTLRHADIYRKKKYGDASFKHWCLRGNLELSSLDSLHRRVS